MFRHIFAYDLPVSKPGGILVIAAAIIAAVRLAREEIGNTPKVAAAIGSSLALAKMIYDRAVRSYPEMFRE